MGMLDMVAGRVIGGATVEFRPTGGSMVPLIHSRQQVTVAPVDPARVEVGDIVLARGGPRKSPRARQCRSHRVQALEQQLAY
jgi:hypothetical protein